MTRPITGTSKVSFFVSFFSFIPFERFFSSRTKSEVYLEVPLPLQRKKRLIKALMKGKSETSKYREYLRQIARAIGDRSSSADSFKMADACVGKGSGAI